MGRYINWEDVTTRYREFSTVSGAVEAGSFFIVYAEGMVDSLLATHYVTPFSNNNITVKDIAIDIAYIKSARLKSEEETRLKDGVMDIIMKLRMGEISMVDEAGVVLQQHGGSVYTNTGSYNSSFGIGDWQDFLPSSMQMWDEQIDRGNI